MSKLYEAINHIDSISGTKEKLKQFYTYLKSDIGEDLELAFHAALNTEINYHIRKVDHVYSESPTMTFKEAVEQLDVVATRQLTGNAGIAHVQSILSSLSEGDSILIQRVLDRSLKCGVSTTNANKWLKTPIPTFQVMLCEKNTTKNLQKFEGLSKYVVQNKSDGLRMIISVDKDGEVKYRSRNGKQYNLSALDHHFSDVRNIAIDCEALIVDGGKILPRKTGNGIINKIHKGDMSSVDKVIFIAWDVVDLDKFLIGYDETPYLERFNRLREISQDKNKVLQLQEHWEVNSLEEVKEIYSNQRAKGEEGIILKNPDGPYEAKRVAHQIKFKAVETADLEIYGFEEGTGKYAGMLGSLYLKTSCGELLVNVGSGLTDKDREYIWNNKEKYLSKIAEVEYNEVIKSKSRQTYSLFLPIYVCIREDKDVANTLEQLA